MSLNVVNYAVEPPLGYLKTETDQPKKKVLLGFLVVF